MDPGSSEYIFKRFDFSEKYRNEIIQTIRGLCNFEFGGHRLYDGSGTHYMQNPIEITDFIFELKRIERDRGKKFASFLEVGFSAGINNTVLNKFFDFSHIVAVDIMDAPSISTAMFYANLRFKNITLVCGNSHNEDTLARVRALGGYDLIFIDADHSYDGVRRDFASYSELLNAGGVLGLHDVCSTTNPGVVKFWQELKGSHGATHTLKEYYQPGQKFECGIGLLYRN